VAKKLKSYRFDAATLELLEELSDKLQCSGTDVIRKAVLLTKAISDNQK